MIANIEHNNQTLKVDLSKPIDISIEIQAGPNNLTAWYVDSPKIEAVKTDQWVGEVKQGGSVNFFNIFFHLLSLLNTIYELGLHFGDF